MDSTDGAQGEAARIPRTLIGVGVSLGVAVGPVLIYRRDALETDAESVPTGPVDPAAERRRVNAALAAAAEELRALARRVTKEIGASEAGIFEAQALMLDDPTLAERAGELIDGTGMSGVKALAQAADEQARALAALPDPLWQARATDVRDAAQRAIDHLRPAGTASASLAALLTRSAQPVIVVADDLTPSDTVQMPPEKVLGIALVTGSTTAHAAILARALGLPAVAGLGAALLVGVSAGDTLILDGTTGACMLHPTQRAVDEARSTMARRIAGALQLARRVEGVGRTADGTEIPVLANVGSEADARAAREAGADGIGLLRTEFLFAGSSRLPDEGEQAEIYTAIVRALGTTSGPIIIRTLDVGADKPLPALADLVRALPHEENPALGVRGLRLQLFAEDLLTTQLRGILRAAAQTGANIRVMLPMVDTLTELQRARTLMLAARSALSESGIQISRTVPLGIMVETPAAVFSIGSLAREAAFLSIGTNDLSQYVMAADRLNSRLAPLCQPLQPAVLRAIAAVTAEAHRQGRHVGVCGEMAGDPQLALLLVGLGVRELSMVPASISRVKAALAGRTLSELIDLATRIADASVIDDAQRILAEAFPAIA